jgi:pimeloyl-ACP methyl ester carboxylesterase
VETVTSKDGTIIAYDRIGHGPAVILVVGAFNDRTTGAPLAQSLSANFTVFTYDRRGKGQSGDTLPYDVDREIEDLEALIQRAGGSALVFGYSSGAVLALRAAAHSLAIPKLALYDPPPTGRYAGELATKLGDLIEDDRRGDAVELFQTDGVGIPSEVVIAMRNAPFRPGLEKIAHTLVYEMTVLTDEMMPPRVTAAVQIPALVIVGTANPESMRHSAKMVAKALPYGKFQALEDQTHDINPAVIAPVLQRFFTSDAFVE